MSENPLWDYSLAVYSQVGVEPLLLQLQDRFGADINIVLCCAWLASQHRELDNSTLGLLLRESAFCQNQCIIPLRTVRRNLKGENGAEEMRLAIKALELDAERWQQDRLYWQLNQTALQESECDVVTLILQHLECYCASIEGADWRELAVPATELALLISRYCRQK